MITAICSWCQKEYQTYPCYLKRKQVHHCSQKCSITHRNTGKFGVLSGRYKDASQVDRDGYIRKWCPARKQFIGEHRLVMERFIGRLLSRKEVVHHIDHNRKNNNLTNLEIIDHKEHSRQHRLGNI